FFFQAEDGIRDLIVTGVQTCALPISLTDLASDLVTYPQVLLNVRVREKTDLKAVPPIAAAIARVESRVAGQGRLLVRYSGTEPRSEERRVGKEGRMRWVRHVWRA